IPGPPDPLLLHLHLELDRSVAVDIAVAFVLPSGVDHMYEHFVDLLERDGSLRLLTGDYLGGTDPAALRRLLDLQADRVDQVALRVFETEPPVSFHPKCYIFRYEDGTGTAFVGSSNLTNTALQTGVEWNYRVVSGRDQIGFGQTSAAFERLFRHDATVPLTETWIHAYERSRRPMGIAPPPPPEPIDVPEPHSIQREALQALGKTRREGNTAALVVLATGLGKTWLSAFDSEEYERVLFVAHREEILNQARRTFRKIRPKASLGLYNGQEKIPNADVLFASIQTLGRRKHLNNFGQHAFDYIIVDEFHHAAAPTYRRLIEHFEPDFLLGLTATPDRTDGQNLLALCQENLVYRRDLLEGIEEGLLAPFKYFGVPDDVDYKEIPWRSSRFDEETLTAAVATQARAENALEQYRQRAGTRTLAFCCSQLHANFMRSFFTSAGERVAAVHSGEASDPRASSLEALNDGELDVIFAVDMFNEGVDLPNVDTIMMLRPTESSILWLQQFGRGLRVAENKPFLTVIDYIGNHHTFLIKPRTLLGLGPGDGEIEHALNAVQAGEAELPPGCEVTYDLKAIEIIKSLLRPSRGTEAVQAFYKDFRLRNGVRPTASEVYHAGYDPRSLRSQFGSWHRFVATMGDLDDQQRAITRGSTGDFLGQLERTPMTKSYKMTLLTAMLNRDGFPGGVDIYPLTQEFRQVMERNSILSEDAGDALSDDEAARRLLEKNPIPAWVEGSGTGGTSYFLYEDERFESNLNVDNSQRRGFQELVREIVDWRLAEYLDRSRREIAAEGLICNIGESGGRLRLLLPDRLAHSGVPYGAQPVIANDTEYEADFRHEDVVRIRDLNTDENVLPRMLRGWFGPDVGRPGTTHRVSLSPRGDTGFNLEPIGAPEELSRELWRTYSREQIPELFGLEFNTGLWNQGFILK
ncbi:MAG: DEAD/DEAH box helicase family protein, partial [Chloroflexota bacterium]